MSQSSKKVRCANLSHSEKLLLVDLVIHHKDTLENKRTDGVSSKAKEAQWKLLAEQFTAQTVDGVNREWQQLKTVCNFLLLLAERIKRSVNQQLEMQSAIDIDRANKEAYTNIRKPEIHVHGLEHFRLPYCTVHTVYRFIC